MPNTTEDLLLSTSEVGALLFCSRSTIERLIRAGRLTPAKQLGGIRGARLFSRSDVDRIAAERGPRERIESEREAS